jgi:tetratricopeptide (TPR) repeat protein
VLNTAAYLAQQAGRHDESIAHMRTLIATIEAGDAIGSPAPDHYNLASALIRAGKLEEGLPPLARAIAIAEATDGRDHANVARYLALRAFTELGLERHAAAEASARRAIAIYEAWFGADDRRMAYPLETMGGALEQQGRFEEAVAAFERAIAIGKRHGNAVEAAGVEDRLAAMHEARGDHRRAAELAARAAATRAAAELRPPP